MAGPRSWLLAWASWRGPSAVAPLAALAMALVLSPAHELSAQDRGGSFVGVTIRGGSGPVATVSLAADGAIEVATRARLTAEVGRLFQGIETCESEFPASFRCSAEPLQALVGVSLLHPSPAWTLRLDLAGGVHRVDREFGGTSPLVRIGGGIEKELTPRWLLAFDVSWSRAVNDSWRDRLGEWPDYTLLGIGVKRRLGG